MFELESATPILTVARFQVNSCPAGQYVVRLPLVDAGPGQAHTGFRQRYELWHLAPLATRDTTRDVSELYQRETSRACMRGIVRNVF